MNVLSKSELRQIVARKAFDTLCASFFKQAVDAHILMPFWEETVIHERLFPIIRTFFRPELTGVSLIRNIVHRDPGFEDKRSHHEVCAIEFLTKLAPIMWHWKGEITWNNDDKTDREAHVAKTRQRLDEAKPWMIEVLAGIRQLEVLWRSKEFTLEQSCLDRLREIALRSEPDPLDGELRDVSSLDEACYRGSYAALFLNKYEAVARGRQ